MSIIDGLASPMWWVVRAMSLLVALLAWPASASAESAWAQAAISPGIQSAGFATEVHWVPPAAPPPNAVTRRVLLTLDPAAARGIDTQLCAGAEPARCVSVPELGRLDTRAFRGVPAAGPYWLRHQVSGQRPLSTPRYIRSRIVVWYD